jgi:hypothetical protein
MEFLKLRRLKLQSKMPWQQRLGRHSRIFAVSARRITGQRASHTARVGDAFGRGPRIDYDARDAQDARRYLAEGKQQSIALLQKAVQSIEAAIADQEDVARHIGAAVGTSKLKSVPAGSLLFTVTRASPERPSPDS